MANTDLYVMFNPFTGLVKIGISNDVDARRDTLEHACGVPLDLLAVFPGDERYEQPLHLAFAHVRQRGEWFLPMPEIIDLVEGRETPQSLLTRMADKVAENRRAIEQANEQKRDRQRQEREEEKKRLEAVKREEARIKAEMSAKRAKAKAERERKEEERREQRLKEWQEWDAAAQARDALYKNEPRERFAEIAEQRAELVRTSQRARNAAVNGVRVIVDG